MAVGSIFGSGIFITTVVLGTVLYVSRSVTLNPVAVNRDIIFYMIGTSVLIIYAYIGYVNQLMAVLYVSIYLV